VFVLVLVILCAPFSVVLPRRMSRVGNTFCSFSCVLEVSEPPASSGGLFLEIPTAMYGTLYSDVPILSRPEIFDIQVNFFNVLGSDFPVGSFVFCQGTLVALEGGAISPKILVRAASLVSIPSPADPSEDGIDSDSAMAVQPAQNANLCFVAKVIATDTTNGCRFFVAQITAYRHKDNGEAVYETFHVACIMAPEVRWGRVRSPSVNSYIQAMGDLVGFAVPGGSQIICVLLLQLSFIPVTRSTLTPSSCDVSPSVVANTDTKVDPVCSLAVDDSPLRKKSSSKRVK